MRRSVRVRLHSLLLPPGLALMVAGLLIQGGVALSASAHPVTVPLATATHDPLADPTLPAAPSQADRGAQVFWLSCMPCHGDRGQGLTEQFRQSAYPPEDQNCWNSGCHGARPYQNGFQLPLTIPALIGPGTLDKFGNADKLHGFIFTAMPFWKPGSLTDDQAWEVTAFLLRENGVWDGRQDLNGSNAAQVALSAVDPTPTAQPTGPAAPASILPSILTVSSIALVVAMLILWGVLSHRPRA